MHVGHCRGAVFAMRCAALLQFAVLTCQRILHQRRRRAGRCARALGRTCLREALGEESRIPEGLYPATYPEAVGQALAANTATLKAMSEKSGCDRARQGDRDDDGGIKGDLAALNIKHDVFFSERSLIDKSATTQVTKTIDYLRSKGDVYEGRLPPPRWTRSRIMRTASRRCFAPLRMATMSIVRCSNRMAATPISPQILPITKTSSIAAFRTWSHVWGADHGGYIKRVQEAIKAVTSGDATLDVKIVQLVRLLRHGDPLRCRNAPAISLPCAKSSTRSAPRRALHDTVSQE